MPRVERLFSENATFQQLEALKRNRNKRHREGVFLVEGVRLINSLVASAWQLKALLYTPGAQLSNWASQIIKSSTAKTHYQLSEALLAKLSDKHKPSELLALVEMKANDLTSVSLSDSPFIVLLDRPARPGNIGTIIRSCDAFEATMVLVTGHAADLFDPRTISATAGSFFAVDSYQLPSHHELTPFLARLSRSYDNLQIVGSSATAKPSLFDADFTLPTVLLVGNEEKGLSHHYQTRATHMVTIPMRGRAASSLNVASATSIFLAEMRRQRGWV